MHRPLILGHRIEVCGKQIKVNGSHWADCESEAKARVTQTALENYFRKGA